MSEAWIFEIYISMFTYAMKVALLVDFKGHNSKKKGSMVFSEKARCFHSLMQSKPQDCKYKAD